MNYPNSLENLIEEFQKLPSIGRKTAQRLSLYIMEEDEEKVRGFSQALIDVKEKIHKCKVCGNYTEEETCSICRDQNRDRSLLCVVEDVSNLLAFEKSGSYRGLYHVLNGVISPSNDIGPDDINLDSLIKRVKEGSFKEVILAISPTVEGETTTLFIAEILKKEEVRVTRIASGIPMGGNLEYFDDMTLYRALEDRRELED